MTRGGRLEYLDSRLIPCREEVTRLILPVHASEFAHCVNPYAAKLIYCGGKLVAGRQLPAQGRSVTHRCDLRMPQFSVARL
jgi:hypothetical protein